MQYLNKWNMFLISQLVEKSASKFKFTKFFSMGLVRFYLLGFTGKILKSIFSCIWDSHWIILHLLNLFSGSRAAASQLLLIGFAKM